MMQKRDVRKGAHVCIVEMKTELKEKGVGARGGAGRNEQSGA